MEKKTQVIMYHHTHWDREWWTTFENFRFRLVNIVDKLLENLEKDPDFCFTLDGQTIVLKDYLEVRPENRERLLGHIRSGRVSVGPWHILPDEFLVSGEAHIRNLWLGERTARQHGVRNSTVGYLPDQFGHAAQMPQILQGFGIDSAVVWRGFGAPPLGHEQPGTGYVGADGYLFPPLYNAEQYPDRMQSEFRWESPDGTWVMGIYLPMEYYRGHYKEFPGDPQATYEATVGRARKTVAHYKEFATTRFLLEPMGGDHLPTDERLPRIIREINEGLKGDNIEYRLGSLEEFVRAVKSENPEFKVTWKGEGRAFGRKAHILPGVLSARLYLKQYNRDCQAALERYAEPLQALNWLLGGRYEEHFLWHSWERLIQNHPHDSICGCSVDQVHREMITRFDESKQTADLLAYTAQEEIAQRIDMASFVPEGAQPFVVFNPLSWTRTDEVKVHMNTAFGIEPLTWVLKDSDGNEVPFQVRGAESLVDKYERFGWLNAPPGKYVDKSANEVTEVFFVAAGVPGLGYKTYYLAPRERRLPVRIRNYTVEGVVAREKGHAVTTGLSFGPGLLENEFLKVEVSTGDGSLTVTDKETGTQYTGLNAFEDGGDAGDTYNYAWPMGDQVLSTRNVQPRVSWVEYGANRATLRVTWPWSLPAELTEDRESRSPNYVPLELHSDITLMPGVKRVDVKTHFNNTAKDHRLQALFPFGAKVEKSSAESHFSVVDRPTGLPEGERGSAEPAVHEHPQMAFVSVTDGAKGLTIANKGLPEFSVSEDETGTIRLTVLRAVGWLSREDFLTRIGGAGPTSRTPEAQMLGPVVAEYSIFPHAGNWEAAKAYKQAHDFNAPLNAVPLVTQKAPMRAHYPVYEKSLAPVGSLVSVEGDLLLSALKKAEDREALVVRFVNEGTAAAHAKVKPIRKPAKAYLVNLREEPVPGGELPVAADGSVTVPAKAWQIVTLAFEF